MGNAMEKPFRRQKNPERLPERGGLGSGRNRNAKVRSAEWAEEVGDAGCAEAGMLGGGQQDNRLSGRTEA